MRRILFALCVLVAMGAVTNPAVAQTIDIVDYMDITPGQWKVEHGEETCAPGVWDEGYSVSAFGVYTLITDWETVNGNWIPNSLEILQITQNNVMWPADYDYETGQFSMSSPPFTIPRSLRLNEPVFNSRTITTGSETMTFAEIFMITETGVSVTTPAGTFNNCIKIKTANIETGGVTSEDENDTSTEIWAPGIGLVKDVNAFIQERTGLYIDVDSEINEVIAYGGP